jgi:hypothetical protein
MAALGDLAVDPSFGKCDMDMEEVLDKAPNCSICLEPVIQGASRSTAQLACSHHFHLGESRFSSLFEALETTPLALLGSCCPHILLELSLLSCTKRKHGEQGGQGNTIT